MDADDKGRQCGRPWPHLSHAWASKPDVWCPGKTTRPDLYKKAPIVVEPDDD